MKESLRAAEDEEKSSNKSIRRILIVIVTVVIIGIIGIILMYKNGADQEEASRKRMDENGAEVPALLNDQFTLLKWQNGKETYKFSYTFDVNGQTYFGTSELARLPNSHRGKAIYDPQNPTMNKLEGRAIPPMIESSKSYPLLPKIILMCILGIFFGFIKKFTKR